MQYEWTKFIGVFWFKPCEFGASHIFVLQRQALAVSLCQPEQGEEGEEGQAEEGSHVIPQSSSSSSTGGLDEAWSSIFRKKRKILQLKIWNSESSMGLWNVWQHFPRANMGMIHGVWSLSWGKARWFLKSGWYGHIAIQACEVPWVWAKITQQMLEYR